MGYVFALGDYAPVYFRLTILQHWQDGLTYMTCLLALLLAHEMGHFLMTVYYRVPASFPYFLPFPISPLGTLGAVIRMDSREADRKQMFDIGIAGPLAGLVVAVPLLIVGIQRLDLTQPPEPAEVHPGHLFKLGLPLGLRMMMNRMPPPGYTGQAEIDILQVNPYFMAGWVGLLVTALNMMPVSQLDGGHITYCMFGKAAHWIARGFMVLAIAYMVYSGAYWMIVMLGLILLIGVDHPPTANDYAPLGFVRYALGVGSLAIPALCLSLEPLIQR
jgi:membrane-associated protease RseP (regulator of RpoE activity)